jgi:hypothetical protein
MLKVLQFILGVTGAHVVLSTGTDRIAKYGVALAT